MSHALTTHRPRARLPPQSPVPPGPQADNPPALGPAGTVHAPMEDYARFVALRLRGAAMGAGTTNGLRRKPKNRESLVVATCPPPPKKIICPSPLLDLTCARRRRRRDHAGTVAGDLCAAALGSRHEFFWVGGKGEGIGFPFRSPGVNMHPVGRLATDIGGDGSGEEGPSSYGYGWCITSREWAGGLTLHHTGSNTMNFTAVWVAPLKGAALSCDCARARARVCVCVWGVA